MSMIERTYTLLTCMIKEVLHTSEDLRMSDRSIREMAAATIKTTPVLEIVSELVNDARDKTGERGQLMGEIELLGIVTTMIERRRALRK